MNVWLEVQERNPQKKRMKGWLEVQEGSSQMKRMKNWLEVQECNPQKKRMKAWLEMQERILLEGENWGLARSVRVYHAEEENENLAGSARVEPPERREWRPGWKCKSIAPRREEWRPCWKCKSVALFHYIVTLISRTLFVFSSTRFFTLIFRTLLGFFFYWNCVRLSCTLGIMIIIMVINEIIKICDFLQPA